MRILRENKNMNLDQVIGTKDETVRYYNSGIDKFYNISNSIHIFYRRSSSIRSQQS